MKLFPPRKALRKLDLTRMSDEIAIESVDPVAVLARQKMWTRRLFLVITSAILTFVACMFLGMKFGSAEQVILTLLAIGMIALLLRVFRSKGRFRFASLLLLTAFFALVFRMVLTPLKRQSDQKAAIEMLNRKGGSVFTYGGADRYPENAHGWVQTSSGYLYPALLAYLEKKFLNPVDVYELKIPSSLISKGTLETLRCEHVRGIEVLLDGSGNGKELSDMLVSFKNLFPEWDHYYFRPLVFVANELRESDIEFLNAMQWGGAGREMPVIRLGLDCHFEPKLFEGLEVGFELMLTGLEGDPSFLNRFLKVQRLERISIYQGTFLKTGLQSIAKRSRPLESLQVYECNFDAESWQLLCNLSNCHSLRLSQIHFDGPLMSSNILQQLSRNKSIEELVLYLDESQASAIPSLMKIEGLKRLEVHCDAHCDASTLSAVQDSMLEDVWLDMNFLSGEPIQWKPWMDKLKSLRLGTKQLVAPKLQ